MRYVMLAAALAACGDNASAVDAPGPPDAAPDAIAPQVWTGTVIDQHNVLVAGAKVCLPDFADVTCPTTGADGAWSLTIPTPSATENIAMLVTADGYFGSLYQAGILVESVGVVSNWVGNPNITPDADESTFLKTDAGFTYPDTTHGFILVRVSDQAGNTGFVATLSPSSGSGPVYLDENAVPKPALTATSSSGGLLFGNVSPGHHDVTVSQAGKTCAVDGSAGNNVAGDWPPFVSGAIGVDVIGGAITLNLNVFCS